jgi:hypothetical protein
MVMLVIANLATVLAVEWYQMGTMTARYGLPILNAESQSHVCMQLPGLHNQVACLAGLCEMCVGISIDRSIFGG